MKTPFLIVLIIFIIIGGIFWAWIKLILKNRSYPVTTELLFSDFTKMLNLIRKTEEKNLKKKYTYIYASSILSFTICFVTLLTGLESPKVRRCSNFDEFLTQKIDGVVIDKFIDYPNHGIEKLTLIKNNRLVTGADIRQISPEIHNYIQKGDTLLKENNSPFILVKNKARTRKFKFTYLDCDQIKR